LQYDTSLTDRSSGSGGGLPAQGRRSDRAAQAAVGGMNPSAALRARRFDVSLGGCILRVEPCIGDRRRDRHQEL
jgi:hypothetical protein